MSKIIKYFENVSIEVAKNCFFIIRDFFYFFIRALACIVPLKNCVCASCFTGTKYSDNTKYIVEKLHEYDPNLSIHWLMDSSADYLLPEYVQGIRCFPEWKFVRRFWEYSTAKVILDTHLLDSCFRKRKGQLFIETWHGGLGIKRIENDVEKYTYVRSHERKIKNTVSQADFFISNSDHLTGIYNRAFGRKDHIWKTGYPKNDILVNASRDEINQIRKKVRSAFSLNSDSKIILYAPTFRDQTRTGGVFSKDPYDIDMTILDDFRKLFDNDNCHLIIKMHPFIMNYAKELSIDNIWVHNGTDYPDMQELIMASDALISDYSSCIFDAALFSIPCFLFAKDFEEYRKDRGVYYVLEELPFPYAKNNEELKKQIQSYHYEEYRNKWNAFAKKEGLYEPGDSAEKIAKYIIKHLQK